MNVPSMAQIAGCRRSQQRTPLQCRNYRRQVISAGWFPRLEGKARSGAGWWLMNGQQAYLLPRSCMRSGLRLALQPAWLFRPPSAFCRHVNPVGGANVYFGNVGREHPGLLATDCLHLSKEALAPACLARPEPSRISREATALNLGCPYSCGAISTVPAFLSHGSHSRKVNLSHL